MPMRTKSVTRVCYFGDYDPSYSRTKVLIQGLKENGVEVIECRVDSRTPFLKKYISLYRRYRAVGDHDAVIIGFTSTRWLPFFARLFARRPVVWDMLFSFYDNWVFDRKIVKPGSLKAGYHWLLDAVLVRMMDRVILHTDASADYFVRTFDISPEKFRRVRLGADTRIFFPRPRIGDGSFRIEYHGKYIPVHGVEVAVRAAKLLEDDPAIRFVMIGDGQEKKNVERLVEDLSVRNIEFIGFLPAEELPQYVAEADLCLGLLGNVPRVEDSIANKQYECAAMGRVSINADTKGVHEQYEDGVDAILVKKGDPADLSRRIREVKKDAALQARLEANALKNFNETSTPKHIGAELRTVLEELV